MGLTTTQLGLILALVLVLVGGLAALLVLRTRRTGRLRSKFGGAEYSRALARDGSRRQGEAGLEKRTERVERLHVRPLAPADRERFADSWRRVQSRFVDGPAGAVAEADQLLGDLMSTRGYPVSDFDQRAADISVDHPLVLANYRTAHEIALRQAKGQADTEELRQAMIHYRSLFDELLTEPAATGLKAAS
jgi:hypothetical protein